MPIRPLALPRDLIPMADMLVEAFQYPDHPEWSIQSDEQRQIVESLRRMAPHLAARPRSARDLALAARHPPRVRL